LFGSFARDQATEESDVDICVELVKPSYIEMSGLREEIVEKVSRPVDIVRVRRGMNAFLRKRIKRDAIYV
jgi:predicted nucleotidyltransferase